MICYYDYLYVFCWVVTDSLPCCKVAVNTDKTWTIAVLLSVYRYKVPGSCSCFSPALSASNASQRISKLSQSRKALDCYLYLPSSLQHNMCEEMIHVVAWTQCGHSTNVVFRVNLCSHAIWTDSECETYTTSVADRSSVNGKCASCMKAR